MIGFQTLTMLEDKAPAPEYGTYAYSALADSMGLGVCVNVVVREGMKREDLQMKLHPGVYSVRDSGCGADNLIHVGRHQLRLR
jgi:hypothetical protein